MAPARCASWAESKAAARDMIFDTLKPVQLAYHVPDPGSAAREYGAYFRMGTFLCHGAH
jgi:hypothetical protein